MTNQLNGNIMTEAQFQETRRVMQSANLIRGLITKSKGEVARWTAIEAGHRNELREGQANGAKKCIEKAIHLLEKRRQKFKDLKLPGEDFVENEYWIVAFDSDSFNCDPKKITSNQVFEAKKEGHVV